MSERNTDHVVMIGDGIFYCGHCGQRYQMNQPAPLTVFTAACVAFVDLHADCAPPAATPTDDPDFREVGQ